MRFRAGLAILLPGFWGHDREFVLTLRPCTSDGLYTPGDPGLSAPAWAPPGTV